MAVISISRDTNNNVSLVRIEVSDTIADFGSVDYILNHQDAINALNGGVWSWFMTDMILVAASDGDAFFYFKDPTFATATIYGEQGSGTVNPAMANSVAYYATGGSSISGITPAANGVLVTSAMNVPSISSTLPGAVQANISAVGTITSGVWNGAPVTVPYGGTGNTTFTAYSLLAAGTTATGTFQNVVGTGTAGDLLVSNGAGALPTWQSGIASGTINTGNVNDLPYYSTNPNGKTLSAIPGAVNSVLITSGMGVPSLSQTLPAAVQGNITALGTIATGVWHGSVIGSTYGGTGVANPTAHGVMVAEGASAMTPIVLGAGQVLIGTTASDPTAAAINSGSGILVGNASGSITVSLAAIADHTLLANTSGGALAPSSTTLTALIDNALGSTQGDILYRNSTVWTVLPPGSAGSLLAAGGPAANPAWTTATFPITAGSTGTILRSNGSNWVPSTSTFADTYGVSTLLYAASSNVVSGLATANSSILITNGSGVPSWQSMPLTVSQGGTGVQSITAYAVICGGTSSTANVQTIASVGTAGQLLQSAGAGALPGWTTATFPATATSTGQVLKADGTNWVSAAVPAVTSIATSKGVTGGTITSTGTVSLLTAPVFVANATGGTTVAASGTPTKIALANAAIDTASAFDTANSKYVPNVAGYYSFHAGAFASVPVTARVGMLIYKNGSEIAAQYSVGSQLSGGITYAVSTIAQANGSTDYFEVFMAQTDVSTQNVIGSGDLTTFVGSLVSYS